MKTKLFPSHDWDGTGHCPKCFGSAKSVESDCSLHWERGYRSHGYWKGDQRLGFIGIAPYGLHDGIYAWSIDETGEEGHAHSLRSAKRTVEKIVSKLQ